MTNFSLEGKSTKRTSKKRTYKHYNVYVKVGYSFGNQGHSNLLTDFMKDYQFIGDTYAVSEAQAINTVRYRIYGKFRNNDGFIAVEE